MELIDACARQTGASRVKEATDLLLNLSIFPESHAVIDRPDVVAFLTRAERRAEAPEPRAEAWLKALGFGLALRMRIHARNWRGADGVSVEVVQRVRVALAPFEAR